MRIASSKIDLSSTHLSAKRSTSQESLREWVGDRRPNFEAIEGDRERGGNGGQPGRDTEEDPLNWALNEGGENRRAVDARRIAGLARRLEQQAAGRLRDGMKAAEPSPKPAGSKNDADDDALDGDFKTRTIKLLIEAMTGRKIKLVSLDDLQGGRANAEAAAAELQQNVQQGQQQRVGWGVEYEFHATHDEFEQTSFAAQGVVKTADGKEISFSYELDMERQFHSETNVSVRAGDALLKDPLVINFGGTAAQLTDETFAFDLDADGANDQVSWIQPGGGFLALDKNGNGTIDDGSELFGATSGDGFAELAAYDDDKNGWIDEADAVYSKLQVWSKSGTTDQHASLKERNVGAISLGKVATPFEMKNASNQLQGAVRSSGVYVKEDGSGVGSVQQIDLAV